MVVHWACLEDPSEVFPVYLCLGARLGSRLGRSTLATQLQSAYELQRCVSRLQAELRPEGPKMEAAGQYYGKNEAN